jgi:hypothetical protein
MFIKLYGKYWDVIKDLIIEIFLNVFFCFTFSKSSNWTKIGLLFIFTINYNKLV